MWKETLNPIILSDLKVILEARLEMLNLESKPWKTNKILFECNLEIKEALAPYRSVGFLRE
jgi:hypothetical protein